MSTCRPNNQRGIALGPILFIIAILAVLAAAIAAGSGSFTSNGNTESANALASPILAMGESYRNAITKLQSSGCTQDTISFVPNANPGSQSFTNSRSPSDHSCDMFDMRGAGVAYLPIPAASIADTSSFNSAVYPYNLTVPYAGYPLFFGHSCFTKFGTCNANGQGSVIMTIPFLTRAVCSAINKILQISTADQASLLVASGGWNMFWSQPLGPFATRTSGAGAYGFGTNGLMEGCANSAAGIYYYFAGMIIL